MQTVLGIDLGTQSLKVVFYDFENRETVAVESAAIDIHQTDDGVAEQKAEWWIHALKQALQQVSDEVRNSVIAIGVSGQQHGFVPIDQSGKVLAPVKLWCDTSTGAECDAIMQKFGGTDACLREVGNLILPGYTASKVRWFRDTHPDLYSQMSCILLPHDYLNFYLSGERCMEAGDASGSGFLNVRTRQWSEEMLRAIDSDRDLRECLPEVRTANELIGYLLQPIALELGLPSGVPISVGGGDNMMAAIGTGNVASGIVTVSLGTSGTVFAYADQPVLDPKGDIAAFCSSSGGWLPLLCTMNCTVSTDLIRNLVGADMKVFESQAASAVPGSDGVLTVPFFNGERTPNLPNARGAILGLNSQNTNPSNLMRSAIEGATYALRFGIDEMRSLGISATEVVLTGGGANSATWRQVAADVFNVPVTTLKNSEGAAFGAALQALAMLDGGDEELSALTDQHLLRDEGKCCEPRQSAVTAYNESYAMYQQAVEGVAALYR